MKDNMYTVIDKKNIYGRIKKIYVKKNDNSQEKYIKSKGEYIVYFDKKDYYIININNIDKYKNNKKIFPNKKKFEELKKKFELKPNMSWVIKKKKVKKVYRKTPGPVRSFKAFI
jgi:aspartyl-tRNA synthetase